MNTTVYALEAFNADFVARKVMIDSPDAEEVLVEMVASGICHSDLNIINGSSPGPPLLPQVLGHEGTGIVREVGSAVKDLKVGGPIHRVLDDLTGLQVTTLTRVSIGW